MERDRILFWKLLEPEHLKARAFCRKLTGDRENGDDLYQDALVGALSGFANLKKTGAFRPWLYRIIINEFKNRNRKPWWKNLIPLTSEIEDTIGGEDPVAIHTARRRLEIGFKAISSEDRAMVTLFEMHGWKISELAQMTGRSEGNIKTRLSRARGKMRKVLRRYLQRSTGREIKKIFGVRTKYALSQSQTKTDPIPRDSFR